MGFDTSGMERWEKGLAALEKGLAAGEDVFVVNETRYLDLARNVAEQTLVALAPRDVDPDDWYDRVREFQSLVFSRMSGKRLEIFYEGRTETDSRGKNVSTIRYEDVLDWVKAGPENGGKDKTAIETNRGRVDEQIAYDVHQAILQHRLGFEKKDYSRITARLEEWVDQRVLAGDLGEMLAAVLDAWVAALAAVVERDMGDWADDLIAGF